MKKYISQKWQKILIGIGIIILVFILIHKFAAPKTIIPDYIKYGKVVTPANLDLENGVIGEAKDNFVNTWHSVDPTFARLVTILMVGILIVLFLSAIASKAGEKKDKKK
ncbi:MAG: hypothetical protein IJ215_03650 [Clostridia bacterium]|nr:hypothetical protein [Clostridia bacterium]